MSAAATLASARGVSPLPPGEAPDWVHLLPPPGTITARDGRVFHYDNPAAVMAATAGRDLDLVVDFEHASESEAARLAGPVRAAGWVRELKADATGIWGRVEWTATARAMIGAREYRYVSPTMMVDPKTRRIMALRSVGLVHHPALPLKALAREEPAMAPDTEPDTGTSDMGMPQDADALMRHLVRAMGLDPDATAADVAAAVDRIVAAVRRTVDRPMPQTAAQTARSREADPASVLADMVAAMMAERWAERALAEDRERVGKVERAFRDGYLTPAMKDWALALCRSDEAAFDAFVAKSGPVFATLSQRIGSAAPPAHLTGRGADDATRRTDPAALIAAQLGLKPGALD